MLGTEKYSTSLSPVSSRSLEGEATSTTMSGASRIIELRSVATPHCTAASGSREVIVVDHHVMPSVKTVHGNRASRHGVAEARNTASLDQIVPGPLRRHRDNLAAHELVAPARLGGSPGQKLRNGHALLWLSRHIGKIA